MSTAQCGDTVTVHYTGLFDSGEVFADSQGDEPIELTIGDGQYIPGFERSVVAMNGQDEHLFSCLAKETYSMDNFYGFRREAYECG